MILYVSLPNYNGYVERKRDGEYQEILGVIIDGLGERFPLQNMKRICSGVLLLVAIGLQVSEKLLRW